MTRQPANVPRRGVLAPLIATAVAFAILVSLGVWQLQRKAWKEGLIAALDQRLAAEPIELPAPAMWAMLIQGADEFRRVRTRVEFIDGRDVYVYAAGSALRPDVKGQGYFVFTPAKIATGETVVINRGFVAMESPDAPVAHLKVPEGGVARIVGSLRWPEASNWFIADRSKSAPVWFVRDHLGMARDRGWGEVAPFYIDLEERSPPASVPKAGPLAPKLRNDHLGYAVTWLGLAVAVIVVFALYARMGGR